MSIMTCILNNLTHRALGHMGKNFLGRNILFALLLLLTSPPLLAQGLFASAAPEKFVMSAENQLDVARIENYLNNIDTLQARFIQFSSIGEKAEGEFFLSRPGNLRIDYDPPTPLLIVTNGMFLVYVDRELEQSTHVPIALTPVGVFVDEKISLNGDEITVTYVEKRAGAIRISLVKTNDPDAGTLALTFSDGPLTLRQWTVWDALGTVTEIALQNPRFGVEIDPEVFKFVQPLKFNNRR